jgi:hypothetical protein
VGIYDRPIGLIKNGNMSFPKHLQHRGDPFSHVDYDGRRQFKLPPELDAFAADLMRHLPPGMGYNASADIESVVYKHLRGPWTELEEMRSTHQHLKDSLADAKVENEELHEEIETLTGEREALEAKVAELDAVNYHGAR